MLDRGACAAVLALAACSFNGGGVADDSADDVDASQVLDSDDDGVSDAEDNCPATANRGQEDEDGDGVGNVCDNCPHLANVDQANAGETSAGVTPDTAGDACDPDPAAAGHDLLYFEGFDDPDVLDDWPVIGGGQWSVSGGSLHQATSSLTTSSYLRTRQFGDVILDTDIEVTGFAAGGGGVGTLTSFMTGAGSGTGYLCLLWYNASSPTPGYLNLIALRGSASSQTLGGANLDETPTPGRYGVRSTVDAGALGCTASSDLLTGPISISGSDSQYAMGFIGLRTQSAAIRIPYLVVFAAGE